MSAPVRPLGTRQLETLMTLSSPSLSQVVPDKVARSLERRGYLKPLSGRSDGFLVITPAGMRASADALEAGLYRQFMTMGPK